MRAGALALAGVLAAALVSSGRAVAEVRVVEHQFRHADLDGWSELPVRDRGDAGNLQVVAGHRHARSGAVLAITRMNLVSPRSRDHEEAFLAGVEDGIENASARYQRFHRRQQRVARVPALDLGFRRDSARGREVVLMRFLFFRRYTVALAVRVPARAYRRHERALRKLVESFEPYVETP
jgi:hypothetical protein